MYQVVFRRQASKALQAMPRQQAQRINEKIRDLARDPYSGTLHTKPLKGGMGWRLRVGDWRVIYQINQGALEILVVAVRSRGGAYS